MKKYTIVNRIKWHTTSDESSYFSIVHADHVTVKWQVVQFQWNGICGRQIENVGTFCVTKGDSLSSPHHLFQNFGDKQRWGIV